MGLELEATCVKGRRSNQLNYPRKPETKVSRLVRQSSPRLTSLELISRSREP